MARTVFVLGLGFRGCHSGWYWHTELIKSVFSIRLCKEALRPNHTWQRTCGASNSSILGFYLTAAKECIKSRITYRTPKVNYSQASSSMPLTGARR